MLIACESVDGGGKTTLVDELVSVFRKQVIDLADQAVVIRLRRGQPIPDLDAFQEYELPLDDPELNRVIRSPTDLVVMDRWAAGEIPYGRIYRGQSRLTDAGMLHVEMVLSAVGALKVLVQPSDVNVVIERLKNRGDDFVELRHVPDIHAWYEAHAHSYGYIRGRSTSVANLLKIAADLALGEPGGGVADLPGYLGDPDPRVILVGDQRNDGPQGRPEFIRAFTPCGGGNSSAYLLTALLIAGMRTDVGIINANEPGVDLLTITRSSTTATVVALGNNASKALTTSGVPHRKVPHPQWHRRFRHGEIDAYAAMIREAAEWRS